MKFISLPALVALAVLVGAVAQTRHKPELREVKATGCTYRPAQSGCLLMKTLDGKTVYNILAQDPEPRTGIVIIIEGKPHNGTAACKQGLALDITKWESTGEKCVP